MIKFKQIGKVILAVIQGKTITIAGDERVAEASELIKEYNENPDPKKLEKIEQVANSEKNEIKKEAEQKVEAAKEEVKMAQKEKEKAVSDQKNSTEIEKSLKKGINKDFFNLSKSGNLQLKDQPYDIPRPLGIEFAECQIAKKSFSHLINFWKLLLLCSNAQARTDAFKYLTKNSMTITKEGYFLTYRRVHLKKTFRPNLVIKETASVPKKFLIEATAKVKKWKGSQKGYFVVLVDKEYKLVRKDKLKVDSNNLGSLYSFNNPNESKIEGNDIVKQRRIFTDNYTKTFEIEIGIPVKMTRADCNENNKESCSRGLHVGTPDFVRRNSGFGEIIIVCLINPMHIISVPYDDAHKMRVCEYLPIKEISVNEISGFEHSDLSEFEYAYMAYESIAMEKQLAGLKGQIDIIDDGTFKNFTKFRTVQDLEKLETKIQELKSKLVELSINNDPISKELDLKTIESIVSSRVITQ